MVFARFRLMLPPVMGWLAHVYAARGAITRCCHTNHKSTKSAESGDSGMLFEEKPSSQQATLTSSGITKLLNGGCPRAKNSARKSKEPWRRQGGAVGEGTSEEEKGFKFFTRPFNTFLLRALEQKHFHLLQCLYTDKRECVDNTSRFH